MRERRSSAQRFGALALPVAAVLQVTAAAACGGPPPALRRVALALNPVTGLSGLTDDGAGGFWAVPERDREVIHLPADGGPIAELALHGVPAGLDLEALAILEDGRLVAGTEWPDAPSSEGVLLVIQVDGSSARVGEQIPVPYALWGIEAAPNRGVEGLCQAGGQLLIGVETVRVEASGGHPRRLVPLARYDLEDRSWTPFYLVLSSPTGRLSSLACRPSGGERLEVLAVERDFGVVRVLGFSVPPRGEPGEVTPALLYDLGAEIPDPPNVEGVDWAADGGLVLLVDNFSHGVTGPNELLYVDRRAIASP